MKPPNVYDVTTPSSHRISNTTNTVQSMNTSGYTKRARDWPNSECTDALESAEPSLERQRERKGKLSFGFLSDPGHYSLEPQQEFVVIQDWLAEVFIKSS